MTDPYGWQQPHSGQQQPPGAPPYPGGSMQYPQGPPPAGSAPYPGYPAQPGRNGTAVAAMIAALVGLTPCGCGPLLGLVGAILGHVSLGQLKKNPNATGHGMAMTGVVAGWLAVALYLGFIVFAILAGSGALGPEWQNA
ncbi:DUF4190 domain-containing protein [Parasphingorhabdus pacifica]